MDKDEKINNILKDVTLMFESNYLDNQTQFVLDMSTGKIEYIIDLPKYNDYLEKFYAKYYLKEDLIKMISYCKTPEAIDVIKKHRNYIGAGEILDAINGAKNE